MKWWQIIEGNRLANLAVWGILLTPLFDLSWFYVWPHFGKTLWFFVWGTLLMVAVYPRLDWKAMRHWLKHPIVRTALIWLGILVLATIFSINPYVSFWGSTERSGGLITAVYIFGAAVALLGILHRASIERILKAIGGVGGIIAVYALLRWVVIDSVQSGHDRPTGSMGNPIFLGSFLVMTIFITLYLALTDRVKSWRLIWWGAVLIQLIALFATLARGPFIGLLVGLLVFTIGWWWSAVGANRRKFWQGIGILLVGGAVVLGGLYLVREPLGINRLFQYSAAESSSIQSRWIVIKSAFKGGIERPILGYGLDNINIAYDRYYNPELAKFGYSETFTDRAHSVLVDQFVAAGGLGLLAMLAFFAMVFITLWRWLRRTDTSRARLLAVALLATGAGYLAQDLVEIDLISNYVYGMLFVVIILLASQTAVQSFLSHPQKSHQLIAMLLGLGLVIGLYLPTSIGVAFAKQGYQIHRTSGNYILADAMYDWSFNLPSPWRHWYLGREYVPFIANYAIAVLAQDRDAALTILDKGVRRAERFYQRDPNHAQVRYQFASLQLIVDYALEGDRHEGDRLFTELMIDHPNRESFYTAWGKTLFFTRRPVEAKEKLIQALAISDAPTETYFLLGMTEAQLGNESAALGAFSQAAARSMKSITTVNQLDFAFGYLVEHGRYEDAIVFQQQLLRLQPHNQQYGANLAVLYRNTGQLDLARKTAELLLQLFPDQKEATQAFIDSLER